MAKQIIWRRQASIRVELITQYLINEWGEKVAEDFLDKLDLLTSYLKTHPTIGNKTNKKQLRKLLITKHNFIVYQITKESIVIITIKDTRQKPTY